MNKVYIIGKELCMAFGLDVQNDEGVVEQPDRDRRIRCG